MLIQLSEELYLQMRDGINGALALELDEVKRLTACISVVRKYLKSLRELAEEHPFESPETEIYFFKVTKPKFYQWLVYYVERYTVAVSRPVESVKELLRHYKDQLKYYRRSLRQYEFYYQYFKMGAVEMDYLYFIRGAQVPSVMIPEVPEVDPAFGTAMDYLFSKFMAYEALQEYLLKENESLSSGTGQVISAEEEIELNWTGETINLLEVAYGWHYTRQINNGQASVIDIVRKMEKIFKVQIGRPYRRLSEIRQRKRLSRTKYIDEMGRAINKKMDDDDGLDPDSK